MTFSEINQSMKDDGIGVFSRIIITIAGVVGGTALLLLFLLFISFSCIRDRKRKHYIPYVRCLHAIYPRTDNKPYIRSRMGR